MTQQTFHVHITANGSSVHAMLAQKIQDLCEKWETVDIGTCHVCLEGNLEAILICRRTDLSRLNPSRN